MALIKLLIGSCNQYLRVGVMSGVGPDPSVQFGEGRRARRAREAGETLLPEEKRSRRRSQGQAQGVRAQRRHCHRPSPVRAIEADLAEGADRTGLSEGEPGVHQPAQGRLLPWDAVVVVVLRFLLVPPGRLLRPGQPGDRWQAGARQGPQFSGAQRAGAPARAPGTGAGALQDGRA